MIKKKPIINKVARYGHKDNVCSIELTRKKSLKQNSILTVNTYVTKGPKGCSGRKTL